MISDPHAQPGRFDPYLGATDAGMLRVHPLPFPLGAERETGGFDVVIDQGGKELVDRQQFRRDVGGCSNLSLRDLQRVVQNGRGVNRVLWYWSSQKETLDRLAREHRIEAADKALQALAARVGAPRSRLKSLEQVSAAAQKILQEKQVERFIRAEVTLLEEERFTQATRGRPGPRTAYIRHPHQRPVLHWQSDAQARLDEARTDGVFPLVTNDEKLTLKEALEAYKHQPSLEKRHEQLKSVLDVRPVMLKNHLRIEAFLFLYFLALMTEALIERDIRARMRTLGIKKLPLYPEERPCAAPTTERLFELFADLRRHRLVDEAGRVHQRFYDKLTEPQRTVLRLFKLSAHEYLSAAEEPASA